MPVVAFAALRTYLSAHGGDPVDGCGFGDRRAARRGRAGRCGESDRHTGCDRDKAQKTSHIEAACRQEGAGQGRFSGRRRGAGRRRGIEHTAGGAVARQLRRLDRLCVEGPGRPHLLRLRRASEERTGKRETQGDGHGNAPAGGKDRQRRQLCGRLPLKEGSEAALDIGGAKFDLFTKDDSAWARTSDLDKTIVAALAKGKQVVIKATPQKGPATTDTYALTGFAQALALIDTACGVKR